MRVDTPTWPAHFLPSPNGIWTRNPGTRLVSWPAVAWPSSSSTAKVCASTLFSQASTSPSTTLAERTRSTVRFRSRAAMVAAAAELTVTARSRGTTNIVRRMPSTLSRLRSV